MKTGRRFLMVFAATLIAVAPVQAEVIGAATASPEGTGAILVEIDPSVDPEYIRQQIVDNIRLTEAGGGEASLQEVIVENGVMTIKFEQADASTLVEAVLDDELAATLKGASAAGGAAGVSGLGLGIGAAVVVGGVVGGLAASGAFDGDDDDNDQAAGAPSPVPPGAPTPVPSQRARNDDDEQVPSPSE